LLETSRVRSCRGRVATQPTTQVSACPSPAHRPAQSGAAADDEGGGAVLMDDGVRGSVPTAPRRRFPKRPLGHRRAPPLPAEQHHSTTPPLTNTASAATLDGGARSARFSGERGHHVGKKQGVKGRAGLRDDFVSLTGACKSGGRRWKNEARV
jgi:hypothetical protein